MKKKVPSPSSGLLRIFFFFILFSCNAGRRLFLYPYNLFGPSFVLCNRRASNIVNARSESTSETYANRSEKKRVPTWWSEPCLNLISMQNGMFPSVVGLLPTQFQSIFPKVPTVEVPKGAPTSGDPRFTSVQLLSWRDSWGNETPCSEFYCNAPPSLTKHTLQISEVRTLRKKHCKIQHGGMRQVLDMAISRNFSKNST